MLVKTPSSLTVRTWANMCFLLYVSAYAIDIYIYIHAYNNNNNIYKHVSLIYIYIYVTYIYIIFFFLSTCIYNMYECVAGVSPKVEE